MENNKAEIALRQEFNIIIQGRVLAGASEISY